ncbi:cytochrome P450 [Streptomyces sp. NPDC007205]|uniref:cytochrome P450 n=1 Tax=Streptomyces sp. NPDC007205 TaxID=3154316 RepID=UPI0033F19F26
MSDVDLFDLLAQPENLNDPYPFYTWLRTKHPVYVNPDGTAYISCYEHAALLKDPNIRDAAEDDANSYALHTINQTLIKSVPPRHTELRRVGAWAFDRSLLARANVQVRKEAERLADQLAASLAKDGIADLHTQYSLPFTQRAAATVFGIPDKDFKILATLPARIFQALYPKKTPDAIADADDASRTLFAYMEDAVRQRYFVPGSGFARLVEASDGIPAVDVALLCWLLWAASYTSALAALDLATLTLIEHPQTAPLLRDNTSAWIEEALRYRSPHVINSINLTTRHDMTIGPVTLPPHTPIRFLIAAMNRDESVFPHPDVFDPHRTGAPHIAFGKGIHTCIGAQLARMELITSLTVISTRLPGLTLAGKPTWRPHTTQRLCSSLPVASY